MSIKDDLQQELEKITDEEPKEESSLPLDPEKLIETVVQEASKRLKSDTLGRVSVVLATLLIAMNNVAVGWLQGEGLISSDTVLVLFLGLILYVIFVILNKFNNHIDLKLHNRDIELDNKDLLVKQKASEIRLQEMENQEEIKRKSMVLTRTQDRVDTKFKQDLELRVPLYQEAQQSMLEFFARDNIVEVLKVPPTFAEAIKKMDGILFQRTETDLTLADMTEKFSKMLKRYESLEYQNKENAMLLNTLVQHEGLHVVKQRELEISLEAMQSQIDSISSSMQHLMQIIDARLPPKELTTNKEGSTLTFTAKSKDPEVIEVDIELNTEDLGDEINELVEKIGENKEEGSATTKSSVSPEKDSSDSSLLPPPE